MWEIRKESYMYKALKKACLNCEASSKGRGEKEERKFNRR